MSECCLLAVLVVGDLRLYDSWHPDGPLPANVPMLNAAMLLRKIEKPDRENSRAGFWN